MTQAFDPLELTQEASINGTFLADLPGAEPAWVGRTAMHLTSLPSLHERASAAGLGTSTAESGVAHILDALASSDTARCVRAATAVATLGRGLGHLIATLKAAPPRANYAPASPDYASVAPSAWRAAYLEHWARVERVWLGGGLSAALGEFFVADARAEVERLGVRGCAIDIAPYADVLALIGAARTQRNPPPAAVVLDFGGSAVKRAVALSKGGTLESVVVLSSRSAPPLAAVRAGAPVDRFVVEVIADTFVEAQRNWGVVDPHVTVSLASYVVGGRLVSAHGTYGSLQRLERRQLEADLRERTGAPIKLEWAHDGTAAARGLVDPGQAGLIVLGTYLAAGFPPPASSLAPVAHDLSVRRTSNEHRTM